MHETTPAATDERTLGLHMTGRATIARLAAAAAPARRRSRGARVTAPRAAACARAAAWPRRRSSRWSRRWRRARCSSPPSARSRSRSTRCSSREAFGTGYGLGQTLFRATPLLFTGLAVALGVPRRAVQHRRRGPDVPGRLRRRAGGRVRAAARRCSRCRPRCSRPRSPAARGARCPGVLKARFGSHEVINTIMLNFIAFSLVSWLRARAVRDRHRAHARDRRRGRSCRGSRRVRRRCAARRSTLALVLGLLLAAGVGAAAVPHAARLRAARGRAERARGGVRRRAHRRARRRWR